MLLLDLPPGTGDIAISVAQLVPGAEILVVTTPQQAAAEVAERAGLYPSTVLRLAASLDRFGYLHRGADGLFRLGNMHLVFETGANGKVVRNFFSSNGNVYHPEPAIAFGVPGYPGPNVNDGIGQLTSDRVQLIEAGNFQPNPGVTVNGACPAPCPGGSIGQGTVNVSGDSPDGGGGGGAVSYEMMQSFMARNQEINGGGGPNVG